MDIIGFIGSYKKVISEDGMMLSCAGKEIDHWFGLCWCWVGNVYLIISWDVLSIGSGYRHYLLGVFVICLSLLGEESVVS